MTTLELTNAINEMDYDYSYSDSSSVYARYSNLARKIKIAISELTADQAQEVYNGLNDLDKDQQFGKQLFEMMPTPTPPAAEVLTASKNVNRVTLFTQAWEMFKGGLFATFAHALKAAWSKLKVLISMEKGNVTFEYVKIDGTIRTAKGTITNFNFNNTDKPEVIKYFDLDVNSIRSFRLDRFLGVVA